VKELHALSVALGNLFPQLVQREALLPAHFGLVVAVHGIIISVIGLLAAGDVPVYNFDQFPVPGSDVAEQTSDPLLRGSIGLPGPVC